MHKISIIVPVYNVESYLSKCVYSVINQTYRDLEILLIDDGSTDSSGALCELFARKDGRIQVIHKKNGGLSDARNAGIETASGDFLFFLDSDDWVDSDIIECLLKLAKKNHADIAECSYRNIYSDHVKEETSNTGELIIADGKMALQHQLEWKYFKSVAWNKLYRAVLFDDGKRYPAGKYHEDEFFTHRVFYDAGKLVYLDLSKYNYVRERAGSITEKVSSKILDSCYALRERVAFAEERNLGALTDKIKHMYCYFIFDRMNQCYNAGIYDDKTAQFIKLLREEEQVVMSWKLSKEERYLYRILCKSYEMFGEVYQDHARLGEKIENLQSSGV